MRRTQWNFLLVFAMTTSTMRAQMTLDYLYRYNCQSGPDHQVTAVEVGTDSVIAGSNQGLALLDLNALPPSGTQSYLFRLSDVNARNLYPVENYLYVNEHADGASVQFGFAIVRIGNDSLHFIRRISEPDVFYDKMFVAGDRLYVAAHHYGIRVYTIANRENPSLIGSLTSGFTDAFDIAVRGDTAYVADGAGGLKLVDVSNPAVPVLLGGEDLTTAPGTSQAVTLDATHVYIAAGSAGIAVYPLDNPSTRTMIEVGGTAEDFAWVGGYLAVSTFSGVVIVDPASQTIVARETVHRRGVNATLRLCSGVGAAGGNRVLCGNWNYMDVYELKPAASSTQADINCSHQRIRFRPEGGSQLATVRNNGRGNLNITTVGSTVASFSTDLVPTVLAPGDSVTFTISYNGSPTQGSGVIGIASNDPDESPLPIQVFGATDSLDPGEIAPDFMLPILRKDHQTGTYIEEQFTLSEHRGQVVWFGIYASW
ncbi:hypothetical protein KKH27_07210 [bacterium]|nr:hypothetical protein [bacterium]MBU1985121.1 hypothetical protein [bacterium]